MMNRALGRVAASLLLLMAASMRYCQTTLAQLSTCRFQVGLCADGDTVHLDDQRLSVPTNTFIIPLTGTLTMSGQLSSVKIVSA